MEYVSATLTPEETHRAGDKVFEFEDAAESIRNAVSEAWFNHYGRGSIDTRALEDVYVDLEELGIVTYHPLARAIARRLAREFDAAARKWLGDFHRRPALPEPCDWEDPNLTPAYRLEHGATEWGLDVYPDGTACAVIDRSGIQGSPEEVARKLLRHYIATSDAFGMEY